MAWFCRRSLQHASPVVEPALLRVRAFAWSNATALVFGVAFAGNLLVNILWMQQAWHYTALRTGLGVAPGPLMVPIFAAVAQSVTHRVSVGWIAAAGCLLLGSGLALSVLLLGPDPSYAAEMLPYSIIGGAGGRPGAAHHLVRRHDRPPAGPRRDRQRHRQHEPAGRHRLGRQRPGGPARDPLGYRAVHGAFTDVRWALIVACALAAASAIGMTPRGAAAASTSGPLTASALAMTPPGA